ncbi:uncharacterized protein LOC105183234 [Harpegnathos saltator]|uniref:DNA-directed RNA polymerase I subunit RPA49 n=1 Tax=Harpegnathos saltator TaxID=610380 RepID=E2BIN0_HARSA|nr:uncharacterized protein LOC105183234 [Harpegnathos saltator]EFN84477.1 DNA-directed RNA polymerase I subunit RPA49 [Harpegnathos saltator]
MKQFKAIIEDVKVDTTKIQPIIVNFQNGELKDEEVKKISCGLFHDQREDQTVLALSDGQTVYKGYKPDPKTQMTRKMLVFHNKVTGKVRLVEAELWDVSPVLQKPVIEENKNDVDDKIAMLNKQFGSKKVKRRTEQYEKLKVNVHSVKDQLEKTVSNIEVNRVDLSTELPNEYITNTNLPSCNREATNVKDVYNIYDIIPKSKLETLYDQAMEILKGNIDGKPKFFTRILRTIQSDPDNVNKVAMLLYIEATSIWFAMPMKDAKKRDVVVCQASKEVNTHIIDTYSVLSASGRLRPNTIKDKAIIHSLILALTILNYTLDLESFRLMLETRISLKKLLDLSKIIGAVPNKDDKKIITLKIPLPAPVPVVKKKRNSINKSNQ